MKKIINKFRNYHPSKPIMMLYLLAVISFSFFSLRSIDNDFWFIINMGRYITNHGLFYIDPFTVHEGLHIVVQQWPVDLLFYNVYNICGFIGIWVLMVMVFILVVFLIYKLCMIISERLRLSIALTTFISCLLILYGYVVTRPQLFDFIFLLLELYILEKYIKDKNNKILFLLPIISLLYINVHASTWIMLILFIIPYLIDSFKFNIWIFNGEGYQKKYLFIVFILMIACAFINPYGIDAITYGFRGTDKFLYDNISEMTIMIKWNILAILSSFLLIIGLIIINIKNLKKIKIRYLCLQLGTMLLGFTSYKGFSFFIIAGFFPLAYHLKDKFLIYKKEYKYNRKFALKYSIILFYIIGIPFLICVFNKFENPLLDSLSKTFDCLQQNAPKGSSVYAHINFGNYLEWLEYKTYDDCRFELFLKKVNGKKDILIENANMTFDKLEKYNFEYFLVTKKDVFYKSLKNNENYELICKQKVKNIMYYVYKKM